MVALQRQPGVNNGAIRATDKTDDDDFGTDEKGFCQFATLPCHLPSNVAQCASQSYEFRLS